jgi:hypothetical protein
MATKKQSKVFTDKQREIIARKMGYDGPMAMFDAFLNSSPTDLQKYEMVRDKFMKRGGLATNKLKLQTGGVVFDPNAPPSPTAAQVTPAQIQEQQDQLLSQAGTAPTTAATATAAPALTAATMTGPAAQPAATMTATTAVPSVQAATEQMQAQQGVVSDRAQVQAAQVEPTQTALAGLQAAQGTAQTVGDVPSRIAEEGEMISGPAVNMRQVEDTLRQSEAAQGVVTEEMTLQGQLSKLMTDFEANNPPPWASAAMRSVNAQLAARGLGASSLAGQAIIQATLESAIPIASADANMYAQMGIQNLSNRQQMAVLTAQQRAQFLGQEFDQAFQTRAMNAARVADIANINFNAKQQIALENARLAQSMDLANLNNQQALVMANAAQIATLETANLNNRQQAAVVNSQAFLQMDMANLNFAQQTEMFKSQSVIQSLFSDQAAENAAKQFNASSENQTNQFFANLAAQVSQFNATQTNAMAQFNTDQTNTISRFNAEVQNQRDQFNAQNRLVIDQANAVWRRELSTRNTEAINRANEFNATKAMEITTIEYNNMWQRYRDNIEYAWKTAENAQERINKIATTEIAANATIIAAAAEKDAALVTAIGSGVGNILSGTDLSKPLNDVWRWGVDAVQGTVNFFGNLFD